MTAARPSRWPVAALTISGAIALIAAGWLTWLRTAVDAGGVTTVSGWGLIGGPTETAGTNINELLELAGLGSYRPALIGLVFGGLALPVGLALAVRAPRLTTIRVLGAALWLCAVAGLGWGAYRWAAPGTAGVLQPGEGTAGWGPVITVVGGLLLAGAAYLLATGRIDPVEPVQRKGIQPLR